MRSDILRVEFWSSVAYPELMGELAAEVTRQGLPAEHRYYYTSAQYRSAKTLSQRLRMRTALYIGYPLKLACRILFRLRKGSTLVVASNTFYAPLVAWMAGKLKGVQVVHLLFDTYPDALIEAGKIGPESFIARGIAIVTRITLKHCHGNVFIGRKLREYAESRYGKARKAEVISLAVNSSDEQTDTRTTDAAGSENGTKRITLLYCGNLGHLHDVETLPAALLKLSPEARAKLHIRYHASGGRCPEGYKLFEEVRAQCPELQFTLGGPLNAQEWDQAMRDADIGISTMRPGAEKVLFPSKTFSAMAMGQAILAVCPENSDLADLVNDSDSGWVVAPGEANRLSEVLSQIAAIPEEVRTRGERASAYTKAHFSLKNIAQHWVSYLRNTES